MGTRYYFSDKYCIRWNDVNSLTGCLVRSTRYILYRRKCFTSVTSPLIAFSALTLLIGRQEEHIQSVTRSSAIAEGPSDTSCQLKSCQLPRNSAETTYTTSPDRIDDMKLEGYSGPMCNKHVHSTMTRSSRFLCLIDVINKPTMDRVVDITCIPTTCCGEIF